VSCDQGKYDEALARVERALDIERDNGWALCSRIDILREAHRFAEAEQAVDKALQARPGDPDVYVAAAWVCSDQDHEVEAADRATKALQIDPHHPAALAAMVYFLRWARLFEEAKRAADDALELRPCDPDILAAAGWVCSDLDQHQEALDYIDQALEIDPCSSWILNCRINFLRAASRYDEAEKFAEQVQRDRPDDPDMQVAAGWLYGDRDQYPAALACFDRALEANPWHLEALVWRSVVQRSLLRFSEAAAAAADATERRPCDLAVRTELGRVYDTQLDFDAALTQFAKVLDREPENVEALIARSAALRSLRRYDEAEREITRARLSKPGNRDLLTELGWIRYDRGAADGARDVFQKLLDMTENGRERAAACYGLGWACFAAGDFGSATTQFRAAIKNWPEDSNYRLGLAWSLARQDEKNSWSEAEDIAHEVARRRPDPFAHACLGVIAFKRGSLASAEYYLNKALELDPYHASHTDLGALYTHTARYTEAEAELREAITRDWHDKAAHIELGCLFLQWADGHLPDAQNEFRRALAIDPASAGAAIGLARALVQTGDDAQAESVLHASLDQQDKGQRWQTHLALAQLLVREGNKQQSPDLNQEAYEQAQQAIGQAPDGKTAETAEPYFVAGLAQYCLASLTTEPVRRNFYQQRARQHMRECLKHDQCHVEAQRYLQTLQREMRVTRPALWGGLILGIVSFGLLLAMWIVYFVTTKVSATVLAVNTPVLAGLFTISALLPALIRLKMPGFEADLQPRPAHEAPGPTGEDTFGPGRFTVTAGPTGQIPRRDQSRHYFGKSTKHR
jgi:tetratricopeptide (TPR) repeat protein